MHAYKVGMLTPQPLDRIIPFTHVKSMKNWRQKYFALARSANCNSNVPPLIDGEPLTVAL
jgi:hypothetical protein